MARCPSHEDRTPSLAVSEGRDGIVLVTCHAGCPTPVVVGALGLKMSDLFPASSASAEHSRRSDASSATLVKSYDYVDADGVLLFQVCRYSPKGFSQRQPNGQGGWNGKRGRRQVLYRLPDVLEAVALEREVLIVEGEKDVDTLTELGFTATTNPGGAGRWCEEFSTVLAGATVTILPDNDAAGRLHAKQVAASLRAAGGLVRVVLLPNLPPKGDVSDWLSLHTPDDLRAVLSRSDTVEEVTDARAPAFRSLSELLTRPELLSPPDAVVPKLAYAGRATLIAAPDKAGKSTLVASATAAVSRRTHFFGDRTGGQSGRVLWVGLEEAVGDAVRRFRDMGAAPENVRLVVHASPKLFEHTREALTEWPADLMIVDSLTEFARVVRGTAPEDGDSSGWAGVVRPLVALTRQFPNLSLIILHHVRRSDGQFRSSGEIAAAVDCLFEMRLPGSDEPQTVRHITGRARWQVEPFDVRYSDVGYELAGVGELSVDARILVHVEQNPGISITKLRKLVGGRGTIVDEAVTGLVSRGIVVDKGGADSHAYHVVGTQLRTGDFDG
jgi:hypothetical protein